MTEAETAISVIIPTLADVERAECLFRAIDTVINQDGVHAIPVVVVNGQRFHPLIVEKLRQLKGIRLHMEPIGGVINARFVGRRLVETPYFGFLDDDDELLPHCLRTRLETMVNNERIDLVVSNGYRFDNGQRSISAYNIADAKRDPFLALLENNWLTPCGALYRTARINAEFFADTTDYAEWTHLAFKLSLNYAIEFLDNPSYVMNDTEGSLSKSEAYTKSLPEVMARILDLPLPPYVQQVVRRKYGRALHNLADHFRKTGEQRNALRCHLRSLFHPGGFHFFLYTRKFLRRQSGHAIKILNGTHKPNPNSVTKPFDETLPQDKWKKHRN